MFWGPGKPHAASLGLRTPDMSSSIQRAWVRWITGSGETLPPLLLVTALPWDTDSPVKQADHYALWHSPIIILKIIAKKIPFWRRKFVFMCLRFWFGFVFFKGERSAFSLENQNFSPKVLTKAVMHPQKRLIRDSTLLVILLHVILKVIHYAFHHQIGLI